eukprot:TRINITY_DN2438_c0_g1_i10.p1 TRINITY_DN2438_c0_g1~~TRINITY_DN2438_c0_g1_i10.p1  ORF type:complete len:297 (-),score=50.62 TRINITY_DN2438_c0_g1_i10:485-1375(-)
MSDFSTEEIAIARTVHIVSASLSLIGTSWVIFTHFSRSSRAHPSFPLRLAFFLSTCYFMSSVAGLISFLFLGDLEGDTDQVPLGVCYLQGFTLFYSKFAAAFWTVCIAYTVYRMIVHLDTQVHKLEKYYHIACWGGALVLSGLMFALGVFGRAQVYCFVVEDKVSLGMGIFVPIVIIVISLDVYFYKQILWGVRQHQQDLSEQLISTKRYQQFEEKLSKRIMHVITVFLLTYFWLILFSLYRAFDRSRDFYLLCLDLFFVPLEGFCDSLIYGDNHRIRKKLGLTIQSQARESVERT